MAAGILVDVFLYLFAPIPPFHQAFALLELCWLIVSIVAIAVFFRSGRPLYHPATFVAYEFGAYFLMANSNVDFSQEPPDFPSWYIASVLVFGVVYLVLTLRFASRPRLDPKLPQ